MPIPPEQYGLTSETTQTLSAGIFAAGAREYLRPAAGWWKRSLSSALCIGGTFLFGPELIRIVPSLGPIIANVLAGACCIAAIESVLKAVEKLDVSALIKK